MGGGLWDAGRFDVKKLEKYFSTYSDRFDLFDPTHPFYQDPSVVKERASTIALFKQELSSGNNALLFDHTMDKTELLLSPAEAARLLITYNGFALDPKGMGGKPMPYGLLSVGVVFMLRGESLFQTLLLNMVQYDPQKETPLHTHKNDLPAWEKSPPTGVERLPDGYLDWLTWQSRRMLLRPQDTHLGVRVSQVIRVAGDKVPKSFSGGLPQYEFDPMFAFYQGKGQGKAAGGWVAVKPKKEKALWRDFFAVFEATADSTPEKDRQYKHPKILDRLNELTGPIADEDYLPSAAWPVMAYGLCKDKGRMDFWLREDFSLPVSYLQNIDMRVKLQATLAKTEKIGWLLSSYIRQLEATATGGKTKNGANWLHDYWTDTGTRFKRLVLDMTDDYIEGFFEETKRSALNAYTRAEDALASSATIIREAVIGGRKLAAAINTTIAGVGND